MNRSGRYMFFKLATLLLASLTLGLSGCVANRAYREKAPSAPDASTKGPVLRELVPGKGYKYSLAFVEFDDLGEMFTKPSEITEDPDGTVHDNTELGQTIAEIKRLNGGAEGSDPVFVVFFHGWKNNASDSSGNVWGFRSELQSLAQELHESGQDRALMGIYIGWRGAATNLPVAKEFSFWNRKTAATRIPGAHLTEAVRRITIAAKNNPRAKCVVVGHSFGGLVMERTLTQAMVEMILENKDDLERVNSRMPDLTVLLNEAGAATESKEFLNFLHREHIKYADSRGVDHPLFLSLTSTGDWATHIIFPVGQFLGKRSLNTRKYDEPDEFGETDQNSYFLHTTANSKRLTNYSVESLNPSQPTGCDHPFASIVLPGTQAGGAERPAEKLRNAALSKTYQICKDPNSKQDTPYWAMQIPTEFVPDHGSVFKPELRVLLEAFMAPYLGLTPRTFAPAGAVPPPPPQPPSPITLQRKPASK